MGHPRQYPKERLLAQFREGKLDDRTVELETRERMQPQIEVMTNQPPDEVDQSGIKDMLANMFSQRTRKRPMKVADAFEYLTQEEESRLLDMDQVVRIAVERVEDSGIVFLDEIDKIAGREGGHGPDISREGVQRDILPIVEGTTVNTKYGMVATDHILFVAAGAFHVSKPSDLIPELQGRFPIRVELLPLTVEDFLRILTEPRASLTKQAIALLETEGLKLEFAPEALEEMARFAFQVNESTENIGARRLHTILEKVLEEISFEAPDILKASADSHATRSRCCMSAQTETGHRARARCRPRVRRKTGRRHRQEPGPEPLHPVAAGYPKQSLRSHFLSSTTLRKLYLAYLLLLVPVAWLSTKFDPYQVDGDGMAYMDIADLLRAHRWAGVVNGYWNPLYPACLAAAQKLFHPTRMNELHAYYVLNYGIFLGSVAAVLLFADALVKLRSRMLPSADQDAAGSPLLGLNALRLLGVGLVVIAAQRELSMGKMRPDALLQALMLAAFAMLLQALATDSLIFAPLMGLFLGLAYLSKSFAFLVAFLSIAVMMLFQAWLQRRKLTRVFTGGALAFVVFAAVAGPYIAALSKQKGRFDFGDSGALNYAWYVSGTDKMHIEPWMTDGFGSASVKLIHPEQQLLAHPGVYSYRAEPYGSYPEWFDTTYFKERIMPRFNAAKLAKRDARNLVLIFRYLLNHPEAWLLLIVLLLCGARLRIGNWRGEGFWLHAVLLGLAMWRDLRPGQHRRALRHARLPRHRAAGLRDAAPDPRKSTDRSIAASLVLLLAFLALGETLRIALENRREQSGVVPAAWYSPSIYGAAEALAKLGVRPGDEVACMGTLACLNDAYWMRLAGVRTLTEVYNPQSKDLMLQLESLPNRDAGLRHPEGAGREGRCCRLRPRPGHRPHPRLRRLDTIG